MLNTGLQRSWEMQQKQRRALIQPQTSNTTARRKQSNSPAPLHSLEMAFLPPKPHFSTSGASTTLLSSSLCWNLSLGSGRMGSSRHQVLLAQAEQLPALTQTVLICTESGFCTSETVMSWEKASFPTSQQAFSYGISSLRGKGREQKGHKTPK